MLMVVGKRARLLEWKTLSLDLDCCSARVGGAELPTTPSEFAVLQVLLSRRNLPMSKETILSAAFGPGHGRDQRMVDVVILRLRLALAEHGLADVIETVAGRGYAILDSEDEDTFPTLPAMRIGVVALAAA